MQSLHQLVYVKHLNFETMGINLWMSSCSQNENLRNLPNPNPDNYTVMRHITINGHLIVELKYHDCTNYEGRKIMVYTCSLNELLQQKLIDPHFCDSDEHRSPIARFEPTDRGWDNACKFVKIL